MVRLRTRWTAERRPHPQQSVQIRRGWQICRRRPGQDSVGSTAETVVRSWTKLTSGLPRGRAPDGLEPVRIFRREGNVYSLDSRRLFAGQYADISLPYRWATPEEIPTRKQTQMFDGTSTMVRFPAGRESWGWWQP